MRTRCTAALALLLAGVGPALAQTSSNGGSAARTRPAVTYAPGAYASAAQTAPAATPTAPAARQGQPTPAATGNAPAPLSVYPPAAPPATAGAAPQMVSPAPAPAPVAAPQPWLGGTTAPCAAPCGNVDGCLQPCGTVCGPAGDVWARGEYLLWWTKKGPLPPLISSGPPGGRGVLGSDGTRTLFGGDGDKGDNSPQSGGRFTLGTWLDCDRMLGLEVSYFFLTSRGRSFDASGSGVDGTTTIARPFLDASRGNVPNAELVAQPGQLRGSVSARTSTALEGWAPNLIYNVSCDCDSRLDAILGFRYYELREDLHVTENLETLPAPGTRFVVNDRFETRNYFYGGAVGAQGEWRRGRWYVNGQATVALGSMRQITHVKGSTTRTLNGEVARGNGGLLALPSNIGRQSTDEFAVIPEVGVRLGAQVTDHIRAFVGYNFLYMSSVVRPGDQVDLSVDPRQLPFNPGRDPNLRATAPAPRFEKSDFWAQGLTFGIEIRY